MPGPREHEDDRQSRLIVVRLGIGAARLGLKVGVEAAKLPFRILSALLGAEEETPVAVPIVPVEPPVRADERPPADATPPTPPAEVAPEEPRPYHPAFEAEVSDGPPVEAPPHIDDEPELVGEFAESGADEGAHAELHVDEPWEGYRSLNASEITRRVAGASAEELAVVQLYETTHRARRTVLDAVGRRSRQLANDPG